MSGIRFYRIVWSMDVDNGQMEVTTEAASSRRLLYDQIKAGKIANGRKKYVKIQEAETPLIDLIYMQKLLAGQCTKKEREALKDQSRYVLDLIRCCAARVLLEDGTVIER